MLYALTDVLLEKSEILAVFEWWKSTGRRCH